MKKYFVDVYWGRCPRCVEEMNGWIYVAVFDKSEVLSAKQKGLIRYTCNKCGRFFPSSEVNLNSEMTEVSEQKARANGLAFESE